MLETLINQSVTESAPEESAAVAPGLRKPEVIHYAACSVCVHPDREEINGMLVAGTSLRKIAGRFGISRSAAFRHGKEHLPSALVKAAEAADIAEGSTLIAKIRLLEFEARRIGLKAEKAGDLRAALVAVHELVRIVELLSEMEARMVGHGDGSRLVVERTILTVPFAALPPSSNSPAGGTA